MTLWQKIRSSSIQLGGLLSLFLCLLFLGVLLIQVFEQGWAHLTWDFVSREIVPI